CLLDVNFFSSESFKMSNCRRQGFQIDRLARGEGRSSKGWVAGEWHSTLRVKVIAKTSPLISDLDRPRSKQHGENQPEHVTLPAIADSLEMGFQILAGDLFSVCVLPLNVVENLLRNLCRRIGGEPRPFLRNQIKTLLAAIKHLRDRVKIGSF